MKKKMLFLLLLLPMLGHAQQADAPLSGEELVEMGKQSLWDYDTAQALKLFDRAIAQGHHDAYANKAYVLIDAGDVKGGLALLKQGAKRGSAFCCNLLGDYYSGEEDYKQAAKYYRQADDPEGHFELGYLYLAGHVGKQSEADMQRGLALVRSAERDGYRDAIYTTARMFDHGLLLEQNHDSAVALLLRLTDVEDAQALLDMAQHCELGLGTRLDSLAAMDYYERAGHAGRGSGYTRLGDYHRTGAAGLQPDHARAFLLYMQAAACDEENDEGLWRVAECYLTGTGARQDTSKALVYLRDAIEAGSCDAAAVLADMYNFGLGGIAADGDTALMLYQMASRGDNPRGDYMMGAYLYNLGVYDNAMGFLRSAMEHGSTDAAIVYARALLWGQGVEADPSVAMPMLLRFATMDTSGLTHYALGSAYYNGLGVQRDRGRAVRYLDTSAAFGCADAMFSLGQLCAGGDGLPRDTVKALGWWQRAAAAGSVKAMMQLASSYQQGSMAPRDADMAVGYYRQAADHGSLDALCQLGLLYEQGDGLAADTRRAYSLYMQAADEGSPWGMRLVGHCYLQGVYVEPDMKQAFEWMLRSAEEGDAQSCYIVGQLYALGQGVKKSKKEARRWLALAADAGVEGAAEKLKEF